MNKSRLLTLCVMTTFLALAGCLLPPAARPQPTGPENRSQNANGTFTLQILFPAGSGIRNVSKTLPTVDCPHALDCISNYANVSCAWFSAAGALSCPGVAQTCFITAVDNVTPSWTGLGGYWTLLEDGLVSSVGASCLAPQAGELLQLEITNKPI